MDQFPMSIKSTFELKGLMTSATTSQSTNTSAAESFGMLENRNRSEVQGSAFSPLAAPFTSRMNSNLVSVASPQEPRVGDVAPPTADMDEILFNIRFKNSADTLFEDSASRAAHNHYMGSSAESVASTSDTIWSQNTASNKTEMFENFDFFVKTLTSANAYVSMLTREQLYVLKLFPPSLLYEFLTEVAKIRTDKRMQRALPHECAFCKNNGENEENYSSHALKDWRGRVQCPVLRAFRCPRCGSTGDRAHTIKYCPISDAGLERSGSVLRRRFPATSSIVIGDGAREPSYSLPSPAQSPTVGSTGNGPYWSNFGMN